MLTFWGKQNEFCDGVSRREFLKVGTLGVGAMGLTLADVLRLQAQSPANGRSGSSKAVIMIYLPGGPTHMDMWDLKPKAPKEYRGEFMPIKTNVPGMEICELFPRQARLMDKYAIFRAVVGSDGSHSANQFMTAYPQKDMRPALGSIVSKLTGPGDGGMPPYVALNRRGEERPAYLGAAHRPFLPSGPGLQNLSLASGVDMERLKNRRSLLGTFDNLSRNLDSSGTLDGMDEFTHRAFAMLSSGKVREAFDTSSEDPRTVELYGKAGTRFLQARRLVEAGARVVTLSYGGWDTHGDNFKKMRQQLPPLDQALAALVTDLDARGLGGDVAVAMWGEFGRTPKVNKNAGRDHWPQVMSAIVAGGGLRTGQVIGETDDRGERAIDRPVTTPQIHGMLYRVLGIDPATTITDGAGRPKYILDDREVIRELV